MDFEPYTPAHHFEGGKRDRAFRTKLKIASQLVELAIRRSVPFKAVVADSFYGEDRGFKDSLQELGAGYVLAGLEALAHLVAQGRRDRLAL